METNQVEKPKPTKTQLFYEALSAYVKANKVTDEWIIALPLRTDSTITRKRVILRSKGFILGRYDISKKEISKSKNI